MRFAGFRPFFLVLAMLCVCGAVAVPEEGPVEDPLKEAVKLGAQADAYNVYCKEDSAMGTGILSGYGKNESAERVAKLEDMRAKAFEAMSKRLADKKLDCESGDYFVEKIAIMRQLKIVMAMMIGVDPKTQKLDGSPLPPPPEGLDDVIKGGGTMPEGSE